MKKILVTGGDGYIAQSLYKLLKNKFNITLITRKNFDLTNYQDTCTWFANSFFDVVIHTAIVGGNRLKAESSCIIDQNLSMYYNLLANKNRYDKFIYFGSGAEIYSINTPYGLSKAVIAESIKDKPNFYNIRIYAVFDQNEDDRRFIKSNIKRYLNNETLVVHENKKMDFFYMNDLIKLIEHYVLKNNLPQTIDCTYNTTHTLFEIANMINNLGDHKCNIIVQKNNTDQNYCGIHTPLLEYHGIEKGIKEVYKHLTL